MAEKMYIVGENSTRLFLRAERKAGIHLGAGFERYQLGTHYEWAGEEKTWFKDTKYTLYVNLLLWKLEVTYVRVRPVDTN